MFSSVSQQILHATKTLFLSITALQEGIQAALYQGAHPGPGQATAVHLRLARVPIPSRRHSMLSCHGSSKLNYLFCYLFIYLNQLSEM